jgi:DNA-binding NarL/FixJ family response regulator
MTPIKLIIADDHPLLVDGLRKVLEEMQHVQVLEPAGNGWQLLERLRKNPSADIVLLDLQMPKLDGIETLKILVREFPRVKVIVFSNYHPAKLVREIKALGAKGYLLKDSTSIALKEAVAAVAAGQTWFQEMVPERETSPHFMDDFIRKYQVTKREVEIIRRIAEGLTSKEISEQLFLSEFTVNAHRRNICRKLNIYTPVGLLNFAKEHGLV